ncbi:hypothetical protein BC332_32361 [Capsicum chinense]|nr:hypothetical protein BC332_32361 [Capsicum chinense]
MMDVMRLLTSHDPNLRSFGAGSAPDTLYEGSFITFGSFLKTVFVFAETAPLDLETDSFYEARKGALLDKIEHGMAEELLIMSWESHVGTACRGVNWDKHSLSELRAAVTCIGGVFA